MPSLRRFACVFGLCIVAGCANSHPSSPGGDDGSSSDLAAGQDGAGAGGTTGQGGAGQGGSGQACGCGGGLAIDVQGDGDPLHLTSADYTGQWRSRDDSVVIDADVTHTDLDNTALTECFDPPRPWAESTSGEGSVVYWIQACAGPGSAPPCLWLAYDIGYSRYVDRTGRAFYVDIKSLSTTFQSFKTGQGQSIDGQFTIMLDDGRTLTGTLRVCVLATINFA